MNARRNNHTPKVKQKKTMNRALSLRLVVLLMGIILVGRLFYLQVIKHAHYNNLAIAEHQRKFSIPASRGTIYFRDNDGVVPAVLNSKVYTLYADPTEVKDKDKVSRELAQHLDISQKEIKELLENKNTSYVVLEKRLDKAKVDEIFKNKKNLIGVNVIPVPQRVYPEGALGAQLLGFVNDEGTGQYGVESALNQRLEGTAGQLSAITDVQGVPLTLDDSTNIAKQPKDGEDIVLTIDRNIQAKAEELLAEGLKSSSATKGSVIVMDPNTGAIKAMANAPSYNPAEYYKVDDDAYEKFQNRVVSSKYEAGSVIKVLTMAVGLNEGVITKDSRFENRGFVQVDDARIKNVEQSVNGSNSMTDVLKYSLNTGVVHVLSQLGGGSINLQAREKLYSYFTDKYGFGEVTGVEQSGESEGIIYGPKTGEGNNVKYSNMAFGQGMDVTMVQTAAALSSVINGGDYYKPHVVEGVRTIDGEVKSEVPKPVRTNVVSGGTAASIREMMRVALSESGAVNRLVRPGYAVGGKTGTSQTIDQTTGRYSDENTIGSYLGYGGDERPRYVIMVRVDDSKLGAGIFTGSAAAAPIFGNLSNWLIDYYNIKPM